MLISPFSHLHKINLYNLAYLIVFCFILSFNVACDDEVSDQSDATVRDLSIEGGVEAGSESGVEAGAESGTEGGGARTERMRAYLLTGCLIRA